MQAADLSDDDDECGLPATQIPAMGKRTLAEQSKVCEQQPTWDSDDDIIVQPKNKKAIIRQEPESIDFGAKRLFSATCKKAQDIAFAAMDAGYDVEIYNMQSSTSINVPVPHAAVYGVYEYREKECAGVAMDVSESAKGLWDYGHDELVGIAVAADIIASSFKDDPDNRVVIISSDKRGEGVKTLTACASQAVRAKFRHQKTTARRIIGHRVCNPSNKQLKAFCEEYATWHDVEEQASSFYSAQNN
jgi:hypothetical protein